MDADIAYDLDFRTQAQRRRGSGVVLLLMAGALWIWSGFLLLRPVPHPFEDCRPPAFAFDHVVERCSTGDFVGFPVFLIALALPLAVFGAMIYSAATTRLDMSEHLTAMQGLADKQRRKQGGSGAAG